MLRWWQVPMTSINRFYETPFEGNKMNDGIFCCHWIETVERSWGCARPSVCLCVLAASVPGTEPSASLLKRHHSRSILNRLEHLKFRSASYKVKALCHGLAHAPVFSYRQMLQVTITLWRRNYFFILAHPVYKMWIIQEPNTLELWNKLNFEEKKTGEYNTFKIFSTYICWINI
jgi:hypothetical protein